MPCSAGSPHVFEPAGQLLLFKGNHRLTKLSFGITCFTSAG